MRRIMLTVAYDGTAYCGWQCQQNGVTIEGVLNDALTAVLKTPTKVMGCSRTDAGVHAYGNLCVFDTEARIPADRVAHALNRKLPKDIAVLLSEEVPTGFHPRKWDSVKTYEYMIYNSPMPNPLCRRYTSFHYHRLNVPAMAAAAGFLVGEHDFASFCSAGSCADTTYRTIYSARVIDESPYIRIVVSGNGFLYNMVRIIAGTLIKIGDGMWPPEQMRNMLAAKDRRAAGPTAPPEGLCLLEIELIDPPFDKKQPPSP